MSNFKRLRSHLVKVGASGVAGQVLTFAALPVLTRLYSPDAFGGWALFLSYALLIGSVSTLRYELAVVLPKSDRSAASLLAAALCSAAVTTILAAALAPLLLGLISDLDATAAMRDLLPTLPFLILSIAAFQLGLAWNTRRAAFGGYSIGQFLLPALTVVGQVGLALAGVDTAAGLIVGTLVGYGGAAGVMWALVLSRDARLVSSGFRRTRIWSMAKRYRNYPLYMTPFTLLGTVRERAIYLMLGAFASSTATGYYALAHRLANVPNSLVSGAVRPIFFHFAARHRISELGSVVTMIIGGLLFLSIPNLLVLFFHAEFIVQAMFGSAWVGAAPYVILLAVPALALLLGNWMDRLLDVLQRQRLAFLMEAASSVVILLALAIGFWLSGDAAVAVATQATVMTLYFLIWIVIVYRAASFPGKFLVRLAVLALALSGGSAILLLALHSIVSAPGAVAAFYVMYAIALFLAWRQFGVQCRALLESASSSGSNLPRHDF